MLLMFLLILKFSILFDIPRALCIGEAGISLPERCLGFLLRSSISTRKMFYLLLHHIGSSALVLLAAHSEVFLHVEPIPSAIASLFLNHGTRFQILAVVQIEYDVI